MILNLDLKENSYDIVIEKGALAKADELLNLERKVLIVTDDTIPSEYSQLLSTLCREPHIYTIPHGENSKSLYYFDKLLSVMLSNAFTRKDCVVALGGGVVGDLSGFAASAYMRGIDFYNIPTTVLSQVDSSIGGKTAVNFNGVKNIVGTFYQPRKVLIDFNLLDTLSDRHVSNGLAEALKMSLTCDAELFELFEKEDPRSVIETIIYRSLLIKKSIVEQDEKESGLRRVLNFGHTLGHGIESVKEPELYHGECVALGMLPMCSFELRRRLLPVYEKLGLKTSVDFNIDEALKAVLHDKKSEKGFVRVIKVDEPGTYREEKLEKDDLKRLLSLVAL